VSGCTGCCISIISLSLSHTQTFKDYLNDVHKSCDGGVNWTSLGNASWPVRAGQAATIYNDQILVAGGCYSDPKGGGFGPPKRLFRGDVWSSPDGEKWSLVTDKAEWSARSGPRLVEFKVVGPKESNAWYPFKQV
jgi:hypothetical protein